MGGLQPLVIVLVGLALLGGGLLGWLLRGERSMRAEDIRRQRLQAQLEASESLTEKLQRQRDELQKRCDDATHRHHQHKRQVQAYRQGLDELASRNRGLEQRLRRKAEALQQSIEERDKLTRQLRLMIRRTRDSRDRQPAVTPTAAAATAPGARQASPDNNDLQRVRGIGPALAKKLRALGIGDLEQLAALSDARIDELDRELSFPGRIRRDRWVEQARDLLEQPAERRA